MDKQPNKNEQLSVTEFEEKRAKLAKKNILTNFPKPVLLLFAIPIFIFVITFFIYLIYIRSISAH